MVRFFANWVSGSDALGAWTNDPETSIRFRLLPEGAYTIGLSGREIRVALQIHSQPQWSIAEMTPVIEAHLAEQWVAELPVSCSDARNAGLLVDGADEAPALLTHEEVDTLCQRFGWRRLSEAEWETCCRSGQSELFAWGDRLLEDGTLGGWMSWEMNKLHSPRNRWGFGSLFFGEWCEDRFSPSHDPQAVTGQTARVIKGGGAQFWPWQTDQDWVWCVSAMRMPSSDLFDDRRAAFRPALGSGLAPSLIR